MRIALVIYGNLDILTGGYRYDRRLVEHLRARGDEVTVVPLPSTRNYVGRMIQNRRGGAPGSLHVIDSDVILQDELVHPSLIWSNSRLRRRGQPIVSIVHHLLSDEPRNRFENAFYRQVEKRFLSSVDAHIANTNVTLNRVEQLTGPGKPAYVAPPSADPLGPLPDDGEIAANLESDGPLRLLLVGNMIRRKGVETLLDALATLRDIDWKLTLVGSLDMEPSTVVRIRRRLAEPAFANRVDLSGPLHGAALGARYASAQLFVMPSTYEGFGMAYLEAMSYGLPVIATSAGGAREIVEHGTNGFLVDPGDAPSLARHIRSLALDPELRKRFGIAGRKRFNNHPTWETSFDGAHEFLHSLTGK